MYNEVNYDLQTLDLPNIVYAHKKGTHASLVIHPFLKPLIIKLAKARPRWRLVGTQFTVRDEHPHWVNRFHVFDGNDELGVIRKDYIYSRSEDVFAIDNSRMSSKRVRGDYTRTKDMTKAFKIITKQFHGKTTEELLQESISGIHNALARAAHAKQSSYSNMLSAMRDSFLGFVENNWSSYENHVAANGCTSKHNVENYHAAKEDKEQADALERAWNNRTGMVVVLNGSDYIVKCNDTVRILSHDDLTPHMKRCIGMLKLAEKGMFIANTGVKSGENEMFIMPEETGDV